MLFCVRAIRTLESAAGTREGKEPGRPEHADAGLPGGRIAKVDAREGSASGDARFVHVGWIARKLVKRLRDDRAARNMR